MKLGGVTRTVRHWAEAPIERNQIVLFSPTLEDAISEDHPLRLLDEILRAQDWSDWVTPCSDHRGRPPIHPRVLAAILLYGLMRRIRSSRMLEYMCGHNLDFLWLAEGHRPDHTTLSIFRKQSRNALKGLFRQVGRLAMALGLVRLAEVAFDGTRVKASASRYHTWTAATVEGALKELDAWFERMMSEADQADAQAQEGFLPGESASHLPAELASAKQRRQKLQEMLQTLRSQDEARQKVGKNPEKNPAQLPQADPDSQVMPNKEGGYAANYTPTAAVDVASGWIVDCEVIADPNENTQLLPAIDRTEENFGKSPEAVLADTLHGTGENLAGMEQRKVPFFTPMESSQPQEGNPARREDPSRPVAEADWPRLPRNGPRCPRPCFAWHHAAHGTGLAPMHRRDGERLTAFTARADPAGRSRGGHRRDRRPRRRRCPRPCRSADTRCGNDDPQARRRAARREPAACGGPSVPCPSLRGPPTCNGTGSRRTARRPRQTCRR